MKNKAIALVASAVLLLQSAVSYAAGFNGEIKYEARNGTIKVINTVSNDAEDPIDVLCIMARYDDNGTLKKAYAEPLTVPGNLTRQFDIDYSYPYEAGDNIKMMIWEESTIQPLIWESTKLVSKKDIETFDSAKLVYPKYKAAADGGYEYSGGTTINHAVIEEEGRIDFLSSGMTITGNNIVWESSSIKNGKLNVSYRHALAQLTQAEMMVYFADPIDEDVIISAKVQMIDYQPGGRSSFMCLRDSNNRALVNIAAQSNGLYVRNGNTWEATPFMYLDYDEHTISYELKLDVAQFILYVDGERVGIYGFADYTGNMNNHKLTHIYFNQSPATYPLTSNLSYTLDDISIDNGI